MKYCVFTEEYYSAQDAAQAVIDNMDESAYDEMLDECYGEVNVAGFTYSTSEALFKLDPIAYRCGMSDYYDSLREDIERDIDRMCCGETEVFYGIDVDAFDDEEETEEEEE